MADNKKGFLLYADQKGIFDKLPNDKAGELIKFIFSYVNDENPKIDDLLLEIAFEPIKTQLKRDLVKWEGLKGDRSTAGILGNLKRYNLDLYELVKSDSMSLNEAQSIARNRKTSQSDTNIAVNDNVNVSVNVNDNKKYNFRNELLALGVEANIADEWIKVRKHKKLTNTETALNAVKKEVYKTGQTLHDILTICVENSWGGFKSEWLNRANVEQPRRKLNKL